MADVHQPAPEEEVINDPIEPPRDPRTKKPPTKEWARQWIVYALLAIIAITVFLPFVLVAFGVCLSEKHWEYLHIVFPAEIGLLTAAMAFYFDLRG
jgi:hypothetical protein